MTTLRCFTSFKHTIAWAKQPLCLFAILFSLLLKSTSAAAAPSLNGVATHTELGKDQFIAGLFLSSLSVSARDVLISNEEKRLQVRVLAPALSSRRFQRMWIEGMAINSSPAELEKHAENLAMFSNFLKVKMIQGDIFSIDRNNAGVKVAINGTIIGEVKDPYFFDLLLRTWIGPVPLSSGFRTDLLASGTIKPESLNRFEATRPSDQRIAAIDKAVAARAAAAQAKLAASAAPKKVDPPKVKPPKVTAPTVAVAKPKKPTPKPRPKRTPTPTPVQIVLAPQQQELDESIFDEDDGVEFTAESLLREQLYYSQLAKFTHRFLKYPQRSWDKGEEGNIRVRVTINREGKVQKTELLEKSPHKLLNKEAKNAVKRANPYPAVPPGIAGNRYSFTFRVSFKMPAE